MSIRPTLRARDGVTLFHVLEHFPFPGSALKNCASLLNENGMLVIAVPNDVESLLTRRNRFMRRLGFKKYQELGNLGLPRQHLGFSELHLSHFSPASLIRAVQSAGFTVEESSLDPYFAVTGTMRNLRRHSRYHFYQAIAYLSRLNLYDTIWLVAKRTG